jgi:ABC-type amino acid transport substrate-binding protein
MQRSAAILRLLTLVILALAGCRPRLTPLAVGTSMDWEPFEYITDDGSYAGFDVELMEEIGRRLNMRVEWREYAFDALIDLLVAGEIDAVIAALNPTPERRARVDFTEPYFESVDAILATEESAIRLSNEQDLAGYRIGVLSATVQDLWIEAAINAEVQRYDRAEQAIAALQNGDVEIVVMSYYAAQPYLEQDGIALVLRSQASGDTMAIAVQKGNQALRDQLNAAIADLQAEGFVEELAHKYLLEE